MSPQRKTYLKQAADGGFIPAMYDYAMNTDDPGERRMYLSMAADQGYMPAMHAYAMLEDAPIADFVESRPRVFICYAKQDFPRADEVFRYLSDAGADPWLDKHKLVLGDDWESEIKKSVAAAAAFVVCLRPGFDAIGFRQQEVRWAIEALNLRPPGRGFIIPFIVEPCELPDWCMRLRIHAGSDLSKPTSLDDLRTAVEKHCGVNLSPLTLDAQRVRRLIASLALPGLEERCAAVEALAKLGPGASTAIPVLADLLESPNTDVAIRQAIARAFANFGPTTEVAIPTLLRVYGNQSGAVRQSLVEAFMKLDVHDDRIPLLLVETLKRVDVDQDERINIAEALLRYWPESRIREALRDIPEDRRWPIAERPFHHAKGRQRR